MFGMLEYPPEAGKMEWWSNVQNTAKRVMQTGRRFVILIKMSLLSESAD